MKTKLSLVLASAFALAACAPVAILNGITPASTFDRTKNVSFGTGERDVMDIYRADEPKADAPVLMFVHGGSWDSGSKDIYKFLAEGFTKSGYDIVVPNYTLYPEAKFPNFLNDNARAVAETAKTFPDRKIVLMGHSAGAYNVLMLALRDEYLRNAEVKLCETVAGVVALAAPTGIVPLESERLIEIFPDRFTGEDAALNNVTSPTPPLFLGHGESDTTVYPKNSQALAEKVIARGGEAVVEVYPGQSHTDVVKVLSRHFDGDTNLKSDIVKFIDSLPSSDRNHCK
ncbi:alpha/beta hydrolase [Litorimonas sp. WD9-15]|uniref:alpha/beta hydrolase n=1 Tax=Litorimonas sp. WD9-15 TaxID=3418716 RepID=UPI003D04E16E